MVSLLPAYLLYATLSRVARHKDSDLGGAEPTSPCGYTQNYYTLAVMNSTEIFAKALTKALDNGWDWRVRRDLPEKSDDGWVEMMEKEKELFKSREEWEFALQLSLNMHRVIFSQHFARSIWPTPEVRCAYCGLRFYKRYMHLRPCPYSYSPVEDVPLWEWHLKQMVAAGDPIEYLGTHLDD